MEDKCKDCEYQTECKELLNEEPCIDRVETIPEGTKTLIKVTFELNGEVIQTVEGESFAGVMMTDVGDKVKVKMCVLGAFNRENAPHMMGSLNKVSESIMHRVVMSRLNRMMGKTHDKNSDA